MIVREPVVAGLNRRIEALRIRIDVLLDDRERWRDLAKKRGKRIRQLRNRTYELEDSRNQWRYKAQELERRGRQEPTWLQRCDTCGAYVPNLVNHRLDSHA